MIRIGYYMDNRDIPVTADDARDFGLVSQGYILHVLNCDGDHTRRLCIPFNHRAVKLERVLRYAEHAGVYLISPKQFSDLIYSPNVKQHAENAVSAKLVEWGMMDI